MQKGCRPQLDGQLNNWQQGRIKVRVGVGAACHWEGELGQGNMRRRGGYDERPNERLAAGGPAGERQNQAPVYFIFSPRRSTGCGLRSDLGEKERNGTTYGMAVGNFSYNWESTAIEAGLDWLWIAARFALAGICSVWKIWYLKNRFVGILRW
jgi:hypothetical protein